MQYIIPIQDLEKTIRQMKADGMDYVVLEYVEPDDDPDDPLPAVLSVQGISRKTPHGWPDYEELELVDPSEI